MVSQNKALFFHIIVNPERQPRLSWLSTVPLESQTPFIFSVQSSLEVGISLHGCKMVAAPTPGIASILRRGRRRR